MKTRDKKFIKKFGINLKQLRISKKITQEKLAFTIGIEISQISRIERGVINTSIGTAHAIAKVLGVSTKSLFDF